MHLHCMCSYNIVYAKFLKFQEQNYTALKVHPSIEYTVRLMKMAKRKVFFFGIVIIVQPCEILDPFNREILAFFILANKYK